MAKYIIPAFNPQNTTSGSFNFPTATFTGKMIISNDSPVNLIFTINNDQTRVSAWTKDRIDVTEICRVINWQQEDILTNAASSPISKVLVDVYDPQDKVSSAYPVTLIRNANVGNVIAVSSASSVINDGSALNTVIVEATPTGQVQSAISFDNAGNFKLRTFDNAVWTLILDIESNNSGAATKLFHGTADNANAVPATGVTAGALPAGVTLAATQLTSGAIPAGVTLAATQLTTGAIPAGVTLAASQLSAGTVPAGVVVDGSLISTGTVAAARLGVGYNAASLGGTNLAPGVAVNSAQVSSGYPASQLAAGTFAAGVTFWHVYNVYDFGAKGDGVTDDITAITAAINAAGATSGKVWFPYGTYLISTPITLLSAYNSVELMGDGKGSIIQAKAGFTGNALLYWAGGGAGINRLTVRDLRFYGGSGTTSANPACDAIQLNSSFQSTLIEGCQFDNINGWAVQLIALSSGNIGYTQIANCTALHCANGYRVVSSVPGTSRVGLILISNCVAQDCSVGDALDLEETLDVTVDNFQGFTSSNSGAGVHIKGCSFVYLSNIDTNTSTTNTAASWKLEAGTSHSNDHIFIDNSVITRGSPGMSIQATTHLHVSNCDIISNQTHGIQIIDDTANGVMSFNGCFFNAQNRGNAGTNYDFNSASTHGKIVINSCNFETSIGAGANQVAAAINSPDNFTGFKVDACNFSGGTPVFNGTPAPKKADIRSCKGFNPVGSTTAPAVPATTVAQINDRGFDCMVLVTGGTVSAVAIGGTATGQTAGWFRVPANQTITLTYTVAPTWTWWGD